MPDTQIPLPAKIGNPAKRALSSAQIEKLNDLVHFTKQQIADLHGIGPKALSILEQIMAENGLKFRIG